jgi:hypothetical protein
MTDDLERRLRQVSPVGAPPELRARVLAAVAQQLHLAAPISSHRPIRFRPAVAVAAGLVVSLGLNVWVSDRLDRRLATVLGPPPAWRQAAEIADDVATITDPSTGRWVYQQLAASHDDPNDARRSAFRLRQIIRQFTASFEETTDETLQDHPQMDRDRHGSRDLHPAGRQCLRRLEQRLTA